MGKDDYFNQQQPSHPSTTPATIGYSSEALKDLEYFNIDKVVKAVPFATYC